MKLLTLLLLFSVLMATAQSELFRAERFTTHDGLASNVVNTAIQDCDGFIWLGTNHGLTRFDGYRFQNYYTEKDGARMMENVTTIVENPIEKRLLLLGNDYRVLCFDLQRMRFIEIDTTLTIDMSEREEEERGYTRRALSVGVECKNITNRRHQIDYVQLDSRNEIFTTTDNGLFVYNPSTSQLHHFSSSDANPLIQTNYLSSVMKDHSGGLWVTTIFGGVYLLRTDPGRLQYHYLTATEGRAEANSVRSFSQAEDNTIVISDMDGGIYRYSLDSGKTELYRKMSQRVYATATDSKGRFWVGTRGGGLWVDDRNLNESDRLAPRLIYDIVFDTKGTAWVATLDGGIVEVKEKAEGGFTFDSFLQDRQVHELYIDKKGRIWMATESGLYMKDGERIDTIYDKCKVVCVADNGYGDILAGTIGQGLMQVSEKDGLYAVTFRTTDDGLANDNVKAIVTDDLGIIVVATDDGISIINGYNHTIRNLYSPQGMMADVYNENAAIKTRDGRILLGSLSGFVELHDLMQGVKKQDALRFPVKITAVEVNDTPMGYGTFGQLRLEHSQNNLRFGFSFFDYNNQPSVIYSYWLEGLDSDWKPSTKESQAIYNNLAPGHYRFHVRANVAGGEWSEETVCDIFIAHPWWWTWWMRLLYVGIILLFVWYEWHQYQQRLSLRRQLDQRLAVLYATEAKMVEESYGEYQSSDKDMTDSREPTSVLQESDSQPTKSKPADSQAEQIDKTFLDKLDHTILENLLQEDLNMAFLSSQMCMSHSTLYRRIKSLTGMTANEYVRKHRLTKAMQLLREGNNVTEVALMCGFNSPDYFSRCFKSEYGISPSEIS